MGESLIYDIYIVWDGVSVGDVEVEVEVRDGRAFAKIWISIAE